MDLDWTFRCHEAFPNTTFHATEVIGGSVLGSYRFRIVMIETSHAVQTADTRLAAKRAVDAVRRGKYDSLHTRVHERHGAHDARLASQEDVVSRAEIRTSHDIRHRRTLRFLRGHLRRCKWSVDWRGGPLHAHQRTNPGHC
jgi:hypothetical protein